MAEYYTLVATLNEYSLAGDSKQLDFLDIKQEILEQLSKKDKKLANLLLSYWDIQNFLNTLNNRENQYSIIGNYSKDEIHKLCQIYTKLSQRAMLSEEEQEAEVEDDSMNEKSDDDFKPSGIFEELFKAISNPKIAQKYNLNFSKEQDIATTLFTIFYNRLANSGNKFVVAWGKFDLTARNISAAYEARRKGWDIEQYLVGKDSIVESILENQKDEHFGLDEIEWVAELSKTISGKDILKKERGLDMLRWQQLEELTTFDYFNINFLLAYILKLTIISRWLLLDEKIGREMFNGIISQITASDLISIEQ